MKKFAIAATLAIATLLISGCVRQGDPDPRAAILEHATELANNGAHENAALLEDGVLTEVEYLEAAGRYQDCMRSVGLELTGPFFSPVDGRSLEWGEPEDETATAGPAALQAQAECQRDWSPMVFSYFLTNPAVMDEPLLQAVQACLTRSGIEFSFDDSNFEELSGGIEKAGSGRFVAVEQCIITEAQILYPDIPGVTVAL